MGYWSDIRDGVGTTLKGMRITWNHMFEPTFTMQYPEERKDLPDSERGIHEYDVERCIACENCAKACPVACIYIDAEGKGKAAKLTRFEIDYQKCLFCNLCVPPCPVDCIKMGKEFDLTGYHREDMIVPFHLGVRPIKQHTQVALEDIEKRKAEAAKAAAGPAPAAPAKPAEPPAGG
ncbi:MAG: NADH-quinone oxidoreductase subunit I [Planctomycetaceae bacterium]|nr:NADH-quinone oxidoreductase subunit I [Planctomycetaceae bacterium]